MNKQYGLEFRTNHDESIGSSPDGNVLLVNSLDVNTNNLYVYLNQTRFNKLIVFADINSYATNNTTITVSKENSVKVYKIDK